MSPTVRQSLPILVLVIAGFLFKQVGLFRSNDSQVLARLIINATLPVVIFLSIARAQVTPGRLAILALCGGLLTLGMCVIAALTSKSLGLEARVAGVVILSAMVINLGFFLFPVFMTIYGQEGISRLAAFDLGHSLVAHSLGYSLATRYGSNPPGGLQLTLARVLRLPVLWGVLAGLTVNLLQAPIPDFFLKILEPLASANTPLAMLTLGTALQLRIKNWSPAVLSVGLRMGVGTLLGQALVALANLQSLEKVAVSLGAGMPIGLSVMVYALSEGLDAELAAGTISLSILVGLFWLPLLLSITGTVV